MGHAQYQGKCRGIGSWLYDKSDEKIFWLNSQFVVIELSLDYINNNNIMGTALQFLHLFLQPTQNEEMKFISVLWILGCLLFSQLLCADDSSVEYKIKAGYLYNFTKFITWSEDNAETFNLCILGDDPFGELIDPIEQRSAFGRPIKLFRFDSLRNDKEQHCHILFISSSIKDNPALAAAIRDFR